MKIPDFFIDYSTIIERINSLDPVKYAKSRNSLDGHISYLSPFITHGIISSKIVADIVLTNHSVQDSEKLLAELGWREFFHRVWQAKGNEIFSDLRNEQSKADAVELSSAINQATTGINAIDDSISRLKEMGYMHNHARMWVASIAGNIAQTHWHTPAKWLYYHLLDGDLASNTLSWQWIVGSFSHKKYYANQENINKYSGDTQRGSFLDTSYESFDAMKIPEVLESRENLVLKNTFPISTAQPITQAGTKILLYSIWNLDPQWHKQTDRKRLLWINPAMHTEFALSPLRWKFISHWASQIPGLEIFVGTYAELFPDGADSTDIITREYPETSYWPGAHESRDWLYPNTSGYFKNFFSFWKSAKKEIPGLTKLHKPHQQ